MRQILLKRTAKAGLKGTLAELFSPLVLRAGFVTTAYRNGVPDEEIMGHTRHRRLTTMWSYVRRAKLSRDSPAGTRPDGTPSRGAPARRAAHGFARQVLTVDPINVAVRERMIKLQLAHARKQMRSGRASAPKCSACSYWTATRLLSLPAGTPGTY